MGAVHCCRGDSGEAVSGEDGSLDGQTALYAKHNDVGSRMAAKEPASQRMPHQQHTCVHFTETLAIISRI